MVRSCNRLPREVVDAPSLEVLKARLKGKKKVHRQWKQGQVPWEEYKEAARLCMDEVRKANAQLELNLARDDRKNKKGFYRQKRKFQEGIPPLPVSDTGKLVTTDKEKAEVINNFLPWSSLLTAYHTA